MQKTDNAAIRLLTVLNTCRRAGLTDPEKLLASAAKVPFMQALYTWAECTPMRTPLARGVLHELQMTPGEAADEWLVSLWLPGREDHPYPHMTSLLTTLRKDGAAAMLCRLTMHAHNHMYNLLRRHHSSFPPAPDGAAQAVSDAPDPLTQLVERESCRERRAVLKEQLRRAACLARASLGDAPLL